MSFPSDLEIAQAASARPLADITRELGLLEEEVPTETQVDLDDIVRVAREAACIARRERRRGFGLTVSASSFVPKPHTPFQWCAQEPMEVLQEKQAHLKGRLRALRIDFKWQHVESSFLEAVFARGSREVGAAIALAHQRGCRFDGWTEQLKFDTWMRAFADADVDPYAIANRPVPLETPLPWDHIDSGVDKAFLLREYRPGLLREGQEDRRPRPGIRHRRPRGDADPQGPAEHRRAEIRRRHRIPL